MTPVYFCAGFGLLFILLVGLAIRNMTKFMDVDSFDDAKGRVAGHLMYGVGASIVGIGFLISLLFAIIDYIKH